MVWEMKILELKNQAWPIIIFNIIYTMFLEFSSQYSNVSATELAASSERLCFP